MLFELLNLKKMDHFVSLSHTNPICQRRVGQLKSYEKRLKEMQNKTHDGLIV